MNIVYALMKYDKHCENTLMAIYDNRKEAIKKCIELNDGAKPNIEYDIEPYILNKY